MILITVSTETFPFNRLMQWIDKFIEDKIIPANEQVIVKYGSCLFVASEADYYDFLPEQKLNNLISEARIIISDCSEETINVLNRVTQPLILIIDSYGREINQNIVLAEQLQQRGIRLASTQEDLARFLMTYTYQLNCC